MKLHFENYNVQESYTDNFPKAWPEFVTYEPSVTEIKKQFAPYEKYKNYIVIGNGGSISSLNGFWGAFGVQSQKNLEVVSTMEPDYLRSITDKYQSDDTLVIAISKSGTTVGVLEALLALKNYPILCITSVGEGALSTMAKGLGWPQIEHPAIGGRFSGRTAVAYGPAHLLGFDIAGIEQGAVAAVEANKQKDSPAWQLAQFLYKTDQGGRNEVFLPVYSKFLIGFNHLITQLVHESVGKDGKGQTVLAVDAPESQHHTNQRFFGGPKNMAGVFVTVENPAEDIKVSVPDEIKNISLRGGTVEDLNGAQLHHSLLCEARGTIADATEQKIPLCSITIEKITPQVIGDYMVFWQFVAYYLAVLSGVNPLDQPQVERSKEIALELRSR